MSFTLSECIDVERPGKVQKALNILNMAHFDMGYEPPFEYDFASLPEKGYHKPYAWGYGIPDIDGLVIMGNDRKNGVGIEFQGRFCAKYPDLVKQLASYFRAVVTRIDIALDVDSSLTPYEAVRGHSAQTVSYSDSKSGQTIYLGSPKSELMARVYKYNEPHPRAGLLRSEIVYRRQHAKAVCDLILAGHSLENIIMPFFLARDMTFFSDLLRVFGASPMKPKIERGQTDKKADKRLRWLAVQVAPAIQKMIDAGISLNEILIALKIPFKNQ